ncbi:4-alpha-glucanotransferase, partial [Akkermansiaceae bacterium]|nr:4-alpha-glucanotransferase [Akkermansiaceae bacterium]
LTKLNMSDSSDQVAGVLAPVTSLRHEGDLGIGDVGGLRKLVGWAVDHEVKFLQLLPINETGADDSPYNAISSVALEPSLIDLSSVPEIGEARVNEVRAGLSEEFLEGDLVHYEEAKRLKRDLLEEGFAQFEGSEKFEAFCETEKRMVGELHQIPFFDGPGGGARDLGSLEHQLS